MIEIIHLSPEEWRPNGAGALGIHLTSIEVGIQSDNLQWNGTMSEMVRSEGEGGVL